MWQQSSRSFILLIFIRKKGVQGKIAIIISDYAWMHNKTPKDMWNIGAFTNGNWFRILFIFNKI